VRAWAATSFSDHYENTAHTLQPLFCASPMFLPSSKHHFIIIIIIVIIIIVIIAVGGRYNYVALLVNTR